MHIRQYLSREAIRKTADFLNEMPTREAWEAWRQEAQSTYLEMLGIDRYLREPRTPLNIETTRIMKRDGFHIEVLSYQSLPGLYVTANLYVPEGTEPMPAVLYVCGHSPTMKVNYQDHARRFAQLGFVTLIIDTIQYGESEGIHHGTHRHGWFNWQSLGYSSTAIEVWNGIRGIDLLCERKEVDPDRIGLTGTSGGGAMTWWHAAADDRIRVLAPSCGTATTASHITERTIDGHCDCMFPASFYGWSLEKMSALVAPRPLLIASAARDGIFTETGIEHFHELMVALYERLGAEDLVKLVTFPGHHSYHEISRTSIFSWFVRHLQGREVSPADIGDIDGVREEEHDLLVFTQGMPPNDETTTVQDWFIPVAEPPVIESKQELEQVREGIVRRLLATSFNAFPKDPPPLDIQIPHRMKQGPSSDGFKFYYVPEDGWRLTGEVNIPVASTESAPVCVALHAYGDRYRATVASLNGLPDTYARARLEPRGTGETAWGSELNWHVRRAAALIGRTIPSMQVLDVLRGLEAIRSFPELDANRITLFGSKEMALVAIYAALLDGGVRTVILQDPPATHDAPGETDGTGPITELLGVLRVTDLAQVAGLLWPTRLIFLGDRPPTYRWAERLYRTLGEPGGVWHVKSLRQLSHHELG